MGRVDDSQQKEEEMGRCVEGLFWIALRGRGAGVCVYDGETDGSKLGRHVACIEERGGSGRAGDKRGGMKKAATHGENE